MIHDITHCKGEGCELRDTCERYLAHLMLQDKDYVRKYQIFYVSYFTESPYETKLIGKDKVQFCELKIKTRWTVPTKEF